MSARVNTLGAYTLELAQYYTNQHQLRFRFDPGTDMPMPTNCTLILTLKDTSDTVIRTAYMTINDLLTGDAVWMLNTPSGKFTGSYTPGIIPIITTTYSIPLLEWMNGGPSAGVSNSFILYK